jgi:pimeloyl-ACP methyl ester carboxylesterase
MTSRLRGHIDAISTFLEVSYPFTSFASRMLTVIVTFLAQAAFAVPFPPPTGPYHVGYTQHVFNNTTPNDPVAPPNVSSILLGTLYYPTAEIPIPGNNTAPYLDPTTAALWGNALQYPNDSLRSLTTWNVFKGLPLDTKARKPTVIFSPGGGENAIMYNSLTTDLASQGYTVLALDHPGEVPYLQLPDGREGVYGIDITAVWNRTLQEAVYRMRVADILATVRQLYPPLVEAFNAPFNTTHYVAIGHSLGGAAAASALAVEDSIIGGVNLDGLFVDLMDVQKPFLMLAGAEHTPAVDPSWSPFSKNQSGWYQWLNVTGSSHQNFADLGDWVDLQCLRNKTITPSLGTIWAPRMDYIVRTIVENFFGFVIGEERWLDVPNLRFPEVIHINGSLGDAAAGYLTPE